MFDDGDIYIITSLVISKSIDKHSNYSVNINNLLLWWRKVIDECSPGCISLRLDEYVVNTIDTEQLLVLIDASINELKKYSEVLDDNYLNNLVKGEMAMKYHNEKTSDVLNMFYQFRKLIVYAIT